MDQPTPQDNGDIPLFDPEGRAVTLGDFRADPLVVVLVRYFGCLPCQHYLQDLNGVTDRFSPNARIIAVGGSTSSQARWLRDTKGVKIPLLLDPKQRVRSVIGLGNLTMLQLSRAKGWANYAKAIGNGFRPQIPSEHFQAAPGIAIFSDRFELISSHLGEMMGDYPPIDELLLQASN